MKEEKPNYAPLGIFALCILVSFFSGMYVQEHESVAQCKKSYENGYKEVFSNFERVPAKDIRKVIIETRDSLIIIPNKFYK